MLLMTIVPSCGEKEEGVGPGITPTPGVTPRPTPKVTPTPTPKVETLKIGVVQPLSGPAAPWGVQIERGADWAADKVNDAGGFKVGDDTYMIELVKCDSKMMGSGAAECATRLVYEEQIHYVIGEIINQLAMNPITNEGKCISANIGNQTEALGPDAPYTWVTCGTQATWHGTFWKQAYRFHPEIRTVIGLAENTGNGDAYAQAAPTNHARYGGEQVKVLDIVRYEPFSSDYYPVLTPVVAKNPDVIDIMGANEGDTALMVKQARELGYRGLLSACSVGTAKLVMEVAGPAYTEGLMMNEPDYSSDLYPEATHQLYAEYQQRYPGEPLPYTVYLGYGVVMFYVEAVQKAGSTDPDEVLKVFDDPDWRFQWFGVPGRSLGGIETYGVRRSLQDEGCYSEVIDGKSVLKSHEPMMVP